MRRDPEQVALVKAEQMLEHGNAGIGGRKVRVVGEGDRHRTWGRARGKLVQTRDVRNNMGKNYPAGN
jgi:hypothetical protein